MRKVILFMVVSKDGFICGPNNELDWEVADESVGEYLLAPILKQIDTILLGKNLYNGFKHAWPTIAKDPETAPDIAEFAKWIEDTQKIVFSRTLKACNWKNSELVKISNQDDIAEKISQLKQDKGKDMLVFGGAQFAQTLIKLNLVDELRLKVQPINLGTGKPLFDKDTEQQKMKLADSHLFASGVVALTYEVT